MRARALWALLGIVAYDGAAACAVSVTGVALGPINPLHDQAVVGAGRITVACDAETPYTLSLSTGVSGSWDRQLSGAGSTLRYNLYLDPQHTRLWGDGSSGSEALNAVASSEPVSHDIHARVPAQPLAPGGHYMDSIVVTIDY